MLNIRKICIVMFTTFVFLFVGSIDFAQVSADTVLPGAVVKNSKIHMIDEIAEDEVTKLLFESEQSEIYTNNGKPIENTMLSKNIALSTEYNLLKEVKVNLFAIISYETNGIRYINYVLSDDNEMSNSEITSELKKSMSATQCLLDENSLFTSVNAGTTGTGKYVHTPSWKLKGNSDWDYLRINSAVEMTRRSSTAVINGKNGSIWDCVARTSFETSGTQYVGNTYTRLSVSDFANQELLDWGPTGEKTGTISVSLSSPASATFSYTFNTSNKIKNLSSQSGKYGRWNITSMQRPQTITFKPAIRISNTEGNVAVDISHTANHYVPNLIGVQVGTGVTRLQCPDRT